VLWPAAEVLQLNQRFEVAESYPGLFAFASDGGQNMLAFDTRPPAPPFAIVAAPFIGIASEIQPVAADFEAFLALLARAG
jgi:hypothetical protein